MIWARPVLHATPKKRHKASPRRRGWAARRDQEARLRAGEDTVRAERQWSTPQGLASPATGLAGSAARTRRNGRGTSSAAAPLRGVRRCASDRYRRTRPERGSAASTASRRARSRGTAPAIRAAPPRAAIMKRALASAGRRGGVRAGLWASRRRALRRRARALRGLKGSADPGGCAAVRQSTLSYPRVPPIAAARREAPCSESWSLGRASAGSIRL